MLRRVNHEEDADEKKHENKTTKKRVIVVLVGEERKEVTGKEKNGKRNLRKEKGLDERR